MPPMTDILDALWETVTLPFGVAAAIVLVAVRLRITPIGAVLAVALGFLAGNHYRGAANFRLAVDQPVKIVDVAKAGTEVVLGDRPASRYWLPWAAAVAGLLGLLARLPMPRLAKLLVQAATMFFAARLVVAPELRTEIWFLPAVAAAMLLTWLTLDALAADGPLIPLAVALSFFAASVVVLHAHSARFADMAMIAGSCWLGLAFVAWRRSADVSAALPIAAVLLPGLMLCAWDSHSSEVPQRSFLLAGLSPLAFLPIALLRMTGVASPRWLFLGLVLLLAAFTYAVRLAMRAETLVFE